MASIGSAIGASTSGDVKTLDASLWFDSFPLLLAELENVDSDELLPPSLAKKLDEHHAWFLHTTTMFKPPDKTAREALDSKMVKIGSHELSIQLELKDAALAVSSVLSLNELQSYIFVERLVENKTASIDSMRETPHLVMVPYHTERQCLLKCTRQIILHASGSRSKEAQKLISDGLEGRLLLVLEGLFLSDYPEQMDVVLYEPWAEEILIEDNLVLDVLFLAYYDCFSACNGKQWKKLLTFYEGVFSGSYNLEKLIISEDAECLAYHVKVQLLLILIETLDFENLLQISDDETIFRQGSFAFSLVDVQEIDKIISSIDVFQAKEAGPLFLAWAVFLRLISSLSEAEDSQVLLEMDHANYVRQAMEAASFSYLLEILESKIWMESDSPVTGYRSVLRTFISAFVTSYEISVQLEDKYLKLVIDILCKIYRSEESLCTQFWDKESLVDGPLQSLLCDMESEFPFRIVEFVQFLSALSEGAWPAECVYNFLKKSVGLSTMFEIKSNPVVDITLKVVEAHVPLQVPGVEGLIIPRGTQGRVLKMINKDTALVRWEHVQSGVVVLLFRMAQELYSQSSEEVLVTLDLLSRLVTYNSAVCISLMHTGTSSASSGSVAGQQQYICIDIVEMICSLVKNLPSTWYGAKAMALGVNILTKMLNCSPYRVGMMIVKTNLFDVALGRNSLDLTSSSLLSESWLLSGRLAKMLMIDCEQSDCSLTLAVMDLTIQLVKAGFENDIVFRLVPFSFQYVLVNHGIWNYKVKHVRWEVTLKVLQVVKTCILSIPHNKKLSWVVRDILLSDSSIHNALFQIVCTTSLGLERLCSSRLYEPMDIEKLQTAIASGLDVLSSVLMCFSKDPKQTVSVFHQSILSLTTKPVPVITAVISLMSFFQNSEIQVNSARLLSMLLSAGDSLHSSVLGNACLGLDDEQICQFRDSVCDILSGQSGWNEKLVVAAFRLLTSAASYQPAFLAAVITPRNASSEKHPAKENGTLTNVKDKSILDATLQYVKKSDDHMKRQPKIMSNVLSFLKALWQGAPQFIDFLEQLKRMENFWGHLSDSVKLNSTVQDHPSEYFKAMDYRDKAQSYFCQSDLFEIIACEIFLHKKLLHIDFIEKQTSELPKDKVEKVDGSGITRGGSMHGLKAVISNWLKNSLMEDMIRSYASCRYSSEMDSCEKLSACLFALLAMTKLKAGDMGSFSASLIARILDLSEKLIQVPAFAELSALYALHGYGQGKDIQHLIFSDLFYHLRGEIEGREIEDKLVKELLQFIQNSNILQPYICNHDEDFQSHMMDVFLYDFDHLKSDIGLELWDVISDWKADKSVAEKMLCSLDDVNGMRLLTNSKLSALKSLVSMLSLCSDNSTGNGDTFGVKIQQLSACIDSSCQCLLTTVESLAPGLDDTRYALDILTAQAELLLYLVKSTENCLSLHSCFLVIKASSQGLKVVSGYKQLDASVKGIMERLLMLVLLSVKLCDSKAHLDTGTTTLAESVETSDTILKLLPILCHCTQSTDHYKLSLTTIDIILRGFSTPAVWFPIIQKHLQLHYILQKLQDKGSVASVPVILQFLLTLGRVREGAVMFVNSGFFAFLRWFFTELPDDQLSALILSERSPVNQFDQIEKPNHIWGLSLAVVTATIHSLESSSSATSIVDYVMAHLSVEKSSLVSYYLSAPDFPSRDHDKKRPRSLKRHTSLSFLKETEQTLMLLCLLGRHRISWSRNMNDKDSELRERIIHFLAFISRGTQRHGELHSRDPPLLCHPIVKDEFELYKKPSFVNSRNGWFALSPLGCGLDPKFSSLPSRTNALVRKDQSNDNSVPAPSTYFSDITAIQMYKIAFLLLEFLCIEAEGASVRGEEVGFVDLAHFPELPMPDILHGLQDQGISIVTELCEGNKSKLATSEIQDLCTLLLQTTEMSLYLELCVMRICGMRPVHGRSEHFLKEFKVFSKATEGQAFLKEATMALKQIVLLVYPELRTEAFV